MAKFFKNEGKGEQDAQLPAWVDTFLCVGSLGDFYTVKIKDNKK